MPPKLTKLKPGESRRTPVICPYCKGTISQVTFDELGRTPYINHTRRCKKATRAQRAYWLKNRTWPR